MKVAIEATSTIKYTKTNNGPNQFSIKKAGDYSIATPAIIAITVAIFFKKEVTIQKCSSSLVMIASPRTAKVSPL